MRFTRSVPTFVIDFDSTLIQCEALDELSIISLGDTPQAKERIARIKELTAQGMDGTIPFTTSLSERLKLLSAHQNHLPLLVRHLKKKITPSFQRNRTFLKAHAKSIFIITGGFREYAEPIAALFGIDRTQVIGNSFTFDSAGNITGCDRTNPLSKNHGKVLALRGLGLQGPVHVIGDGVTDYEIREAGLAERFIAFIENVERESVVRRADLIARSFDEVLFHYQLPRKLSFPKSKLKVLLLEGIDPESARRFRTDGFVVETASGALDEHELAEQLTDVSILGVRSKTQVTGRALAAAHRLLAIGAFCIGTDQTDIRAATRRGVALFNAPYSNTRSVVELALGEIIMLLRRIFPANAALHRGEWQKSSAGSYEVRGKVLGIVGYGKIGSQLSVLAEDLGMKVLFFDIEDRLALGNAHRCRSLKELLQNADVVSLHIDGRESNRGIFGPKEFRLMKKGASLLNLSRGQVVVIEALHVALTTGHLAGAAIDVFPEEPKGNKDPFLSPLCGLPNVILTPHIGGSTLEAQRAIAEYTTERLLEFVNEGSTYGCVNLPEVRAPKERGSHRLLHLHRNVPGILAHINGILSEHRINIEAQYLKTRDDTGYVITDVNKAYSSKVLELLRRIPDTIRFRVLY